MRWRQCLLDANVLVLYVAGRIDKGLIGSHRRLREYADIGPQTGQKDCNYGQYID